MMASADFDALIRMRQQYYAAIFDASPHLLLPRPPPYDADSASLCHGQHAQRRKILYHILSRHRPNTEQFQRTLIVTIKGF